MKKLLVVEDDILIKDNIKEFFEINDFQVKCASNGADALNVLENFTPDVIVSDMMMPNMDGIELLEKLRENKSTNLIPFLMLTARAENDIKRKSMNMGADDYITKPFEFNELYDAVNSQIKKKSQVKQHITEESLSNIQHLKNVTHHEIYTPINVLQNIINVIKIESPIDPEVESIFNHSLKRLKKTLNNLMILSDVQELNNNFTHYTSTYINKFINDSIIDNIKHINKDLKINRNINLPAEFFCREYVLIVLAELIEIVFKLSDKDSLVNIDFENLNSNIKLEITCNASILPNPFSIIDTFHLKPEIYLNEHQNMGLGLYIISTLANKYRDDFKVEIDNNMIKYTWICYSNH